MILGKGEPPAGPKIMRHRWSERRSALGQMGTDSWAPHRACADCELLPPARVEGASLADHRFGGLLLALLCVTSSGVSGSHRIDQFRHLADQWIPNPSPHSRWGAVDLRFLCVGCPVWGAGGLGVCSVADGVPVTIGFRSTFLYLLSRSSLRTVIAPGEAPVACWSHGFRVGVKTEVRRRYQFVCRTAVR
jgi:hypothetical protein